MSLQVPQVDAVPVDLKGEDKCQKAETVFNITLTEAGYEIDPRVQLLYRLATVVPQPLTPYETELVAHELRKGGEYLQQLQQLPDGWDRNRVTTLMGWAQQLFEKPLAEKRGFNAQCDNPITSPRHDDGLGSSQVSHADSKKLLDDFGLNMQDRDLFKYLGGHVVAGKRRPGAHKLVLLYLDQHMSMPLQRRLIETFYNLYQDGVRTVALEGQERSGKELLANSEYADSVQRLQKDMDRSNLQTLLTLLEQEGQRIKKEMEEEASLTANAVYYPAYARLFVLAAMLLPKGRILGVDDEKIVADMSGVCWTENQDELHPMEQYIIAEACHNYVIEFRSHLAVRNLKKLTESDKKKEVIFMPFGLGHALSMMGELLEDDYKDYSYLVVAPPEVFMKPPFEDTMWVNEMIMKAKARQ